MIHIIAGWLLVLAGGLIGAERIVARQPDLKETLQHVQIYQESVGLLNLLLGLGGVFHALSTATTHSYAPLYWLLSAGASFTAAAVGVALSAPVLNVKLQSAPMWLHRGAIYSSLWVRERAGAASWLALSLGLWRGLDPLFGG
ncbi:MAG: hypothetical protein FJ138_17435 [Deltaproteobacteria bacterium]|nr:hypothetical protein [Deltaproteobacteria bacterium]